MTYKKRAVDSLLEEYLNTLPAIALVGPRAVGKTETASQWAKTIYHLDETSDRTLVEANPKRIAEDRTPVLLDEWQRLPELIDVVRREVDKDYTSGRYLLTGSVMPSTASGTHTGAGRITRLRMRPMALFERITPENPVSLSGIIEETSKVDGQISTWESNDYAQAICTSGFPQIANLPETAAAVQLESYLQDIIDQDAPDSDYHLRRPDALFAWMRAYAAVTATTTSYTEILKAATPGVSNKPAKSTTEQYRDFLRQIWILDPLPAWDTSFNPITRLAKSPKHYLADPALAATLLDIDSPSLYRDPVMAGRLFEALAVLSLRTIGQNLRLRAYHLRTQNGDHEVDVVLRGRGNRIIPVEIKFKTSITDDDCAGLTWFEKTSHEKPTASLMLYAGTTAYRRRDGVYVIPLSIFCP